ncbi:hypothetical protein QUC31_020819 [Theobroma cacao]
MDSGRYSCPPPLPFRRHQQRPWMQPHPDDEILSSKSRAPSSSSSLNGQVSLTCAGFSCGVAMGGGRRSEGKLWALGAKMNTPRQMPDAIKKKHPKP